MCRTAYSTPHPHDHRQHPHTTLLRALRQALRAAERDLDYDRIVRIERLRDNLWLHERGACKAQRTAWRGGYLPGYAHPDTGTRPFERDENRDLLPWE